MEHTVEMPMEIVRIIKSSQLQQIILFYFIELQQINSI